MDSLLLLTCLSVVELKEGFEVGGLTDEDLTVTLVFDLGRVPSSTLHFGVTTLFITLCEYEYHVSVLLFALV